MLGTYMSDCGVNVHKSGELKIPTIRLSKLACTSAVGALADSAVAFEHCEHTTPVGRNGGTQPETISVLSTRGVLHSCRCDIK